MRHGWIAAVAAALLTISSAAAIAKDSGGGGDKSDHNDKSNLPLCDGSPGQVENQNCRMPN